MHTQIIAPACSRVTIPRGYLVSAALAIDEATQRHPNLSASGWTTYKDSDDPSPLEVEHVATALMFILHGPVQRLRKASSWSSYGAKHAAENWGRHLGFSFYITNGAFLAACLHAGVPLSKRLDPHNPNSGVGLRFVGDSA